MSPEYVRSRLAYDPATGILTWRENYIKSRIGKAAGHYDRWAVRIFLIDRKYPAHRLAWFITHGEWPKRLIDHINGNPHDNRLCNLRECDVAENAANQKRARNNNSGHKGVRWHKGKRVWFAAITRRGVRKHLGIFKDVDEAREAYAKAAKELFGEFARVE